MGGALRDWQDTHQPRLTFVGEPLRGDTGGAQYSVLECFTPLDADPADIAVLPEVEGVSSWMSGVPISVHVEEPLEFGLDPNEPGPLKEMYNGDQLVMSAALVTALAGAGVDNLQVFRAVLVDPMTGKRHHDYRAVNVIGCVSAADLGKSRWTAPPGPPIIDVDFDSLAIDETKAGGFLLFRLAECISAIVVHSRVRQYLLAAGFSSLTFLDPSDYVG